MISCTCGTTGHPCWDHGAVSKFSISRVPQFGRSQVKSWQIPCHVALHSIWFPHYVYHATIIVAYHASSRTPFMNAAVADRSTHEQDLKSYCSRNYQNRSLFESLDNLGLCRYHSNYSIKRSSSSLRIKRWQRGSSGLVVVAWPLLYPDSFGLIPRVVTH